MKKTSVFAALQKARPLLTRADKIRWVQIVGFSFLISLLELVTAGIIVVFARVLTDPQAGVHWLETGAEFLGLSLSFTPHQAILCTASGIGAVYLVKNVLGIVECFFQQLSIQSMACAFRARLLRNYAHMDYGLYLTRNSSFYANIAEHDTYIAFFSALTSLAIMISEGFVVTVLFFAVIYLNPVVAGVVSVIVVSLGCSASRWVLPRFSRWGERYQEEYQLAYQHVYQFFHAFKELILLGKREYFIEKHREHSLIRDRTSALKTASGNAPRFLIEGLFIGVFVVTILILCLEDRAPTAMMATLGGYLYAGFRLMPSANRVLSQVAILEASAPAIERVYKEFQLGASQEDLSSCPDFRFDRVLTLRDVSFRYLNTERDALSQISLEIRRGEVLGIVGATGSGKSTLIDLLLGLLKPREGAILVDEAFSVSTPEWHRKIGYVPQALYLVDGTIAKNIAFGCDRVDEERLSAVIQQAQLGELVESLPDKAATLVGERGVRLSGGERQRIAIARALYHDPEVLIFDEATSALDNTTETKLMETIHSVSTGRTVIMVAHRVTTLKNCSRILVMKRGKIEKITTYEQLESQ